jgi:hypothetical protein
MKQSITRSAVGVLGWLKKISAEQEEHSRQAAVRQSFPVLSGVQLEFDLGLPYAPRQKASSRIRRTSPRPQPPRKH